MIRHQPSLKRPDNLCTYMTLFRARDLGAGRIATGHDARIDRHDWNWRLRRARDQGKDQSYFLHQLGQAQLAATVFPLGDLLKTDVRRMAAEAGLPTAGKDRKSTRLNSSH